MSNSVRAHGLQPTRLLRPWYFPGKSTGVGCHCLLLQVYKTMTLLLRYRYSGQQKHTMIVLIYLLLLGDCQLFHLEPVLECLIGKESESEVAQSGLTLSDPMDRSPPGSSVHGIFQARVLEWGAIAFSHHCL